MTNLAGQNPDLVISLWQQLNASVLTSFLHGSSGPEGGKGLCVALPFRSSPMTCSPARGCRESGRHCALLAARASWQLRPCVCQGTGCCRGCDVRELLLSVIFAFGGLAFGGWIDLLWQIC